MRARERDKAIIRALWSHHDKPERWVGLSEIADRLSPKAFYKTFVDIWVNSESNDLFLPIIDDLVDQYGIEAGVVMPTLGKADRDAFAELPETFTVWRGATIEDPFTDYSWTVDKEKAVWFAKRCHNATPSLIEGTARKGDILFYTDSRNEKEVAVRTEQVDIRKVTPVGRFQKNKSFAIFSAVQRGGADAIFGDTNMFQVRAMHAAITLGWERERIESGLLSGVEELEILGFDTAPRRIRDGVESIDWDQIEAIRNEAA